MTPEEAAERASLTAALAEYHAHPGRHLLPKVDDGRWTVAPYELPPQVTGGYTYKPTQDWLEAPDPAAGMDIYRLQQGRYGIPVPGIDPATGQPVQRLHPRVGQVADRRIPMSEYLATQGPVKAPPSPGSSAKAQQLKGEDRPRITDQVRKKKEREAEQQARAEARAAKAAAKAEEAARRAEMQGPTLLEHLEVKGDGESDAGRTPAAD